MCGCNKVKYVPPANIQGAGVPAAVVTTPPPTQQEVPAPDLTPQEQPIRQGGYVIPPSGGAGAPST